jgi:hypothetical protein
VYKAWLSRRLTVEEAEAEHAVEHERLGPSPVPFGFQNDRWKELLAGRAEGDELWEFCSPPESWQHRAGRTGIALVRDGEIIDSIVTVMN